MALYKISKFKKFLGIKVKDKKFNPIYFETECPDELKYNTPKCNNFMIEELPKVRILDVPHILESHGRD